MQDRSKIDRFVCICEIADNLHEPGPYFGRSIIVRISTTMLPGFIYVCLLLMPEDYSSFSCCTALVHMQIAGIIYEILHKKSLGLGTLPSTDTCRCHYVVEESQFKDTICHGSKHKDL